VLKAKEVFVMERERLSAFKDWLEAKEENPNVVLTIKWIAEFEEWAEDDEENLRAFKELLKTKGQQSDAIAVRKAIVEFEETIEDEDILDQFKDWLTEKGDNRHSALALWWIAEFEQAQKKSQH
jgi:hypothetical protein